MHIVLIIIGIIAFVGGIIFFAHHLEKKRSESWQAAAEELALEFFPEGDQSVTDRLQRFTLMQSGRSRKLKNLIRGTTEEVGLAIFDYQYTTGSGKQQQTHKQTVVLVESPLLVIPNFSMRVEGFFDKIGGMLGFQDIDFESHPKFSQMYVLKGSNETEIRKFFTPQILEYFENKGGVSVESNLGGSLIFYKPRTRRKPEELKELLADAYEIFGIMADQTATKKA